MAIRYRILRKRGFVHLEIKGEVSLADIRGLIEQVSADPVYLEMPLHFTDITGVSASWFKLADIRQLASLAAIPGERTRGAILAPDDLIFGLCRQFQAIRGSEASQVFRTLEEALEYLGIGELPDGGEWKLVSP